MVTVLNSTPLIYLGKTDSLDFLEAIAGDKVTSATVYEEVVEKGKELGAEDAFLVERLFEEETVLIEKIENEEFLESLLEVPGLHRADAEVLALTRQSGGTLIIDDEKARAVAELKNISHRGTAYILLKLRSSGYLSKERARSTLDEMIRSGWRCSTEIYAEILKALGF